MAFDGATTTTKIDLWATHNFIQKGSKSLNKGLTHVQRSRAGLLPYLFPDLFKIKVRVVALPTLYKRII